jgi:hypothetical protein
MTYLESVYERYRARFFQGFEGSDGGHQLHAIVGGELLAAENFLLVGARAQDRRPAAWARDCRCMRHL